MQRIDDATAAAEMPAPAAAGTPGYFTEGNPAAGEAATIVTADFLNMMMMELINVVIGSGLAPSKAINTQVRDAMPAMSANANSMSALFPSGLLIQVGTDTHTDGTGAKKITFAKPYSSPPRGFAGNSAGGPPVAFHGTGNETNTDMMVYSAKSSGVAADAGTSFKWFAIGMAQ